MKKNILIAITMATAILSAATLTSCNKSDSTKEQDLSIINDNGYKSVWAAEHDVYFTFNSTDDWTLSVTDADWLSYDQSILSGKGSNTPITLTMHVAEQRENESRSVNITVTSGEKSVSTVLTQMAPALPSKALEYKFDNCSAEGGDFNFQVSAVECSGSSNFGSYKVYYAITVSSDSDWVTINSVDDEDKVSFTVAENTETESRKAVITIYLSDGTVLGTATVSQAAAE